MIIAAARFRFAGQGLIASFDHRRDIDRADFSSSCVNFVNFGPGGTARGFELSDTQA